MKCATEFVLEEIRMPDDVLWPLKPHTQAKHAILRRYLEAWFPILNRHHGRILYFDGFAGPGEYEHGEPGSPIIALEVAANHRRQMRGEVVFWFVEARQDRFNHLQQLVGQLTLPRNLRVNIQRAEFHEVLRETLDSFEQTGDIIAPTFAFIDPFGFSGVPMELIHRLLAHPSTEAFICFQVGYVNRFLEHPDSQISAHTVELFGSQEVLDVPFAEGNRIDRLRCLYQGQLKRAARYVRFFSMYNQRGQPIYDLFFAGNNELGHYRMKDAMWKVDEDGQFRFSDATDPSQLVLFRMDHAPQFLDSICHHFAGQSNMLVRLIQTWVRNSTPFLDKHMRAALRLGEEQERFVVHPAKLDGKKRRRGTFPENAIIDFPVLQ
jgi:three-Cys-motif partner protein